MRRREEGVKVKLKEQNNGKHKGNKHQRTQGSITQVVVELLPEGNNAEEKVYQNTTQPAF